MTRLDCLWLMILTCLTDSMEGYPITSQVYEDFYEYNNTKIDLSNVRVTGHMQQDVSLDSCIQACREDVNDCQSLMWSNWTYSVNSRNRSTCNLVSVRGNYFQLKESIKTFSYVKKPLLFLEFPLVFENSYCDDYTETWNVADLFECGRVCHQYTKLTKGRGICNAFNYIPDTLVFWPDLGNDDRRLKPQCNLQTEQICKSSTLQRKPAIYYARDTSRPIPPRSSYSLTVTSDGDSLLVSADAGRIFSGFQLYEEREVSCKIVQATFKPNLTDIESYFKSRAHCIDLCRYDTNCSFITYGGNMASGKNCLVYKRQYCRHPNKFTIGNLINIATKAVDSYQKLDVEMDDYDIYPAESCNETGRLMYRYTETTPLDVFECEANCAKRAGCGAFRFERGDCKLRRAICAPNMTQIVADVYRTGLPSSTNVYVRKPGRTARLGGSNFTKFFNEYRKQSCLAACETTTSNETILEKCLYSAILSSSNMVHFVANAPRPCFLHATTCNNTARHTEEQTTLFIKTQDATQINKFDLHVNTECKYPPAFLQDLNTFDAMACGRRCDADPKCKSFFFFPLYPAAESKKYPKFTGNCELKASVCRTARRIYGVYNYYISRGNYLADL